MLRVTVEVVPYGFEDMKETIAVMHIGRDNQEDDAAKLNSNYRVDLIEGNGKETAIGRFRLHRYGWYRNRLGLAARALKMLQTRRNAGEFLPEKEPVGYREAYRK
jgi:hypothetical protein